MSDIVLSCPVLFSSWGHTFLRVNPIAPHPVNTFARSERTGSNSSPLVVPRRWSQPWQLRVLSILTIEAIPCRDLVPQRMGKRLTPQPHTHTHALLLSTDERFVFNEREGDQKEKLHPL